MTVWFTSDQHIGHRNIIEYAGRPFTDVAHMNAEIARRWREVVDPSDLVVVLGDVVMGSVDDGLELVASLPGEKHLIWGNHDRCFPGGRVSSARLERERARYLEVFETIEPSASTIIGGTPVRLSHFPFTGESRPGRPDRFAAHRLDDDGGWLVHGHTHSATKVRGRMLHIGVDAWDFTPVPEAELAGLIAQEV